MRADDFDYHLPLELIAQHPPPERDGGRLMLLERSSGAISHHRIVDLPELLPRGALLVVNDSRVIPARLWARRATGGRVEVLLVERESVSPHAERWRCLARSSKSLRAGELLTIEPRPGAPAPPPSVRVVEPREAGQAILDTPPWSVLAAHGAIPLPPYIRRADEPSDRERYQTVYARDEGSIAAPTAGLHLSPRLLERLDAAGIERRAITLHVGPGTFAPVRSAEVEEHHMESERYHLPAPTAAAIGEARAAGRRVVAVGTTVVRCLESAQGEGEGRTALFITPGHRFRVVDGLLTNFHLPRSTLVMLVAAFAGRDQILAAYRAAVEARYRFYSYGDAMLIQ
jgi:S-adenosylmethionine:tRNA ribosyltransferase-isomerase